MGKHFLSVLGTGLYENSIYYCSDGAYETSYVQQALLKLKLGQWEPEDRISIFLTEKAREMNWLDRQYKEYEIKRARDNNKNLPDVKKGLGSILIEEYGDCVDDISQCMIPIGANEDELWTIFQVVFDSIREGEDLYIDITHSLRNIPIQMLAVIMYARVVKNIQIKGIYYGAFEAGKRNEYGIQETPIMDLLTFVELIDWSQAANTFVKYGNSEQIYQLYQEYKKYRRMGQRDLSNTVSGIHNLTRGLEMSQGYYIKEKKNGIGALGGYKQYKKAYQSIKNNASGAKYIQNQDNMLRPLGELMDVIDKRIKVFDVDTNFDMGMAAIQWAIDNGNTQQGFTALAETIKTYLCNYYGLEETKREDREDICKSICMKISKNCDGNGKPLSAEKRKELFQQWRTENCEKKELIEVNLSTIQEMFLTLPVDLAVISRIVGDIRNNMNHFGYSVIGGLSSKNFENDLKKYFNEFKAIIETMQRTDSGTNEKAGE